MQRHTSGTKTGSAKALLARTSRNADANGARRETAPPSWPRGGLGGTSQRRQRLPWVAAGLATTLTSVLVFVLWAGSLSERTAVLAAARDIPAGRPITSADLLAVDVAGGEGGALAPVSQLDAVLGRTAVSPIPAGTMLHTGLFGEPHDLAEDQVILGAVLTPGEYPVLHLQVGQRVGVVITSDSEPTETSPSEDDTDEVLTEAVVTEIFATDGGQQNLLVSLVVARQHAVEISAAAANGDLRLVLLPPPPAPEETVAPPPADTDEVVP